MVTAITSMEQFRDAIKDPKGAVIDFHAEWCGPCKMISPKFEAFSGQYTNLNYYSIDVDAVPEVAEECGISAMPTFQTYREGTKIASMRGAVPNQLEEMIKKASGEVSA